MPLKDTFSSHIDGYIHNDSVQKMLAQSLIHSLSLSPNERILDVGCGYGTLHSLLPHYELFVGVDRALKMCEYHPYDTKTFIICGDFDTPLLYQDLQQFSPFSLIISSSSLQWSHNLPLLFKHLSRLAPQGAFALFTSQTFHSLFSYFGLAPILPSYETITQGFADSFQGEWIPWSSTLHFTTTKELLTYIRTTGINANPQGISPVKLRRAIEENKVLTLEYHALILKGKSRF